MDTKCSALRNAHFLKSARALNSQEGIYIVYIALSLIAILLVLGLAIDAANLYHAQRVTQNAADAGALAGMEHYATNFRATSELSSLTHAAESTGEAIARQNLELYGYQLSTKATFTFNAASDDSPSARTLQVTNEVPRDLYLLNFFAGMGPSRTVHASATVNLKPAVVVLLLDVSGSMICPAVGNCACLNDADPSDCGPVRKIDKLMEAVNNFVAAFDPTFDRIAVIPFRTGATIAVPLQVTRGFDKNAIAHSLDSYPALFARDAQGKFSYGATNPSDAFIQAMLHVNELSSSAPEIGVLRTSYVLFSDGAPTAGRLWFTTPQTSLVSETPPGATGPHQHPYDYYSWSLAWQDKDTNLISGYSAQKLAHSPITGYSWNPYAATGEKVPETAFSPSCSTQDPSNIGYAISNCVNDFTLMLPVFSGDLEAKTVAVPKPFESFREVYYDATISLSDHARAHHGLVYAVGLGEVSGVNNEPYQDINDVDSLKNIFLARVAKDRRSPAHPQFTNFPVTSGNLTDSGLALTTANAQELSELFSIIAKRIKLQIIQ